MSALYTELGRSPTKAEIAEKLDVPLDTLLASSKASSIRVLSLEGLADMTANGALEKLTEMADDDPRIDPTTPLTAISSAANSCLRLRNCRSANGKSSACTTLSHIR